MSPPDNRWTYRRDLRQGDKAHGITFHMWESVAPNVRAEATTTLHKLHLDGKVSVTLAEGQYKYGDELIVQVYGDHYEVRPRHSQKHQRCQVFLGRIDEGTATMLEQVAAQIRRRIRGEHGNRP